MSTRHTTKHPTQPVEIDDHGVARFKANRIVQYLLDAGPFDMNHLARLTMFTRDDRQQFAQLIGYSVGGYSELDYHYEKVAVKSQEKVEALLEGQQGG